LGLFKGGVGAKWFSEKWIQWVMQTVKGEKVSINANNDQGKFFRKYKGLR
jgi:hypothetical protein